jgi:hypothetical protein
MRVYVVGLLMAKIITTAATNNKIRCDQPHPVDLKELKKPLLQICVKEDRSIPYLVRKAVKFWLENNYPDMEINTK